MIASKDYTRVMQRTFDLNAWASALKPGCLIDAQLPVTERWAPARVLSRAPPPFQRWLRVAFEGLPLSWYVCVVMFSLKESQGPH